MISLGANPKETTNYVAEFANGEIGGTIWEPLWDGKSALPQFQNLPFKTFATEFQPIVGVIASSTNYWNNLSTAQKALWETAIREANKRSATEIYVSNSLNSKYSKVVALTPEQIQSVSNAIPDKEHFLKDYKLIGQAEAFLSSQVKKKAN